MQTALLEMQRIEDRRREIDALMATLEGVAHQGAQADQDILQHEVVELRASLAHSAELQERAAIQSERAALEKEQAANAVRAQMEGMHHELTGERIRNTLLHQELHNVGYPVVGMELSEGAPYDIAGVWVVSVARGGAADAAGIRKGDVISEVGGICITTREAFRRIITGVDGVPTKPGHQLSFRIHRESDAGLKPISMNVMVTLGWSSRRPEGRRAITVTRTDLTPSRGTPQKRVLSNSPSRGKDSVSKRHTDRSVSPSRQSRFL